MRSSSRPPYRNYLSHQHQLWWNLCRPPSHHHHSPALYHYPYPNHPDPRPRCSAPSLLCCGAKGINANTPLWSYTSNQPPPSLKNQRKIAPWKKPWTKPQMKYHPSLNLRRGCHTNRQEDNTERLTLSNMENNRRNLGRNSSKTQDHLQPRRDPHPQAVKCPFQNTSSARNGNQSHRLLPMSRRLPRFPPLRTYLSRHLPLVLLIGILLPSPSGTPRTPAYPNSPTSRICVVANF